jgi:DNA-binding transcriptional MerR regulator
MIKNDQNRYNITQLAAALHVSQETIRLWCEEFERYLSPRANPGNRQKRNFISDDIEVLTLVAELKHEGLTFSSIHAALDNGERGEVPLVLRGESSESDGLILRESEKRLTQQIQQLQLQLQEFKALVEQLQEERDEAKRIGFRHEVRAEILAEQLEKTERRVRELLDERSKLEREIGSMESDLRRKDDDE